MMPRWIAAALLAAAVVAHAGIITQSGGKCFDCTSGGGDPGGDLTHGSTASISGTGFDAVASPVYIYDDFSVGTDGDQVFGGTTSFTGEWGSLDGAEARVYYDDSVTRGVHSQTAFHNMTVATGGNVAGIGKELTSPYYTGKWYIDWWCRVEPVSPISDWTRSYKVFRFYGTDGFGDNFTHNFTKKNVSQFHTWLGAPGIDTPNQTSGEWVHYRLRFNIDPSNVIANDYINYTIATNGTAFALGYEGGWRDSGHSTVRPRELNLGNYWASDADPAYPTPGTVGANSGARIHTSSIYVANSWARVELCNNATYASATICEIQPTNSRTNTAITYTVNKGLLSSGTVYEKVFDTDNNEVKSTARTLN